MLLHCIALLLSLGAASHAQKDLSNGEPYSQGFEDNYSILKHTGPYGPYSNRRSYGLPLDPPESCTVNQVILYHRHGERYPDDILGKMFDSTLGKLKKAGTSFKGGDLAFLDHWKYWAEDECLQNQETFTGPYAGRLDAFRRGNVYRERYGHLLDQNITVPIFSSGFQRVVETARKFGEGFFADNYSTNAAMNIISEDASSGANSLAPQCYNVNITDLESLIQSLAKMPEPIVKAANRLNDQYSSLNLTQIDAFSLLGIATLELNARASSPWVNVFKAEEWAAYDYVMDRLYFYGFGPGSAAAPLMGSNFVNSTVTALLNPRAAGKLLFNFAHDSNIMAALTAFDILDFEKDLPQDKIVFNRRFRTVDIVPMGGHIVIERLNCNGKFDKRGNYVRMILNEAVVPVKDCQSGPGFSCPLQQFAKRYSNMTSYTKGCAVPATYPQSFTAWWDYNKTTELNFQKGPVQCAQGKL